MIRRDETHANPPAPQMPYARTHRFGYQQDETDTAAAAVTAAISRISSKPGALVLCESFLVHDWFELLFSLSHPIITFITTFQSCGCAFYPCETSNAFRWCYFEVLWQPMPYRFVYRVHGRWAQRLLWPAIIVNSTKFSSSKKRSHFMYCRVIPCYYFCP